MNKEVKRICAIFPGALGDFICFLPALRVLRQMGPVDLYARREFAALLPDSVIVRSLDSNELNALFRPLSEDRDNALRRWRMYHVVYSWHGSGHPEFMQLLQELTLGRAQFFRFRPLRFSGHQSDYYLSCLDHQAVPDAEPEFIALRDPARRWSEQFWLERGLNYRPTLALAPGSGAREKNWPAEFFLEVAEWWRETRGGEIVLILGPVERERGGLGMLPGACLDPGELTLDQVAAILERCVAYIGNDSGISHLAAVAGARTIALFGPSDPRGWAPQGPRVLVLRYGLDCSPCDPETMRACPHRSCLVELRPRDVIAALAALPEVVTLTR